MPAEQWLIAMSVSVVFLVVYTFYQTFIINRLRSYNEELEVELFEERKNKFF